MSLKGKFIILCWSVVFTVLNSQLVINEIMATNGSEIIETDFYNYPDWVELYNSGTSNVSLGNYYLSDDKSVLLKWRIPGYTLSSGGYRIIYLDGEDSGIHANFGLDADGETLYLVNGSKQIIDSVRFPQQYPSSSYGRNVPGGDIWRYCSVPTPGDANQPVTATKPAPKPIYSVPAGRLTAATSVALAGDNIKYSTNGSIPDINSTAYSTPIPVSKTTVVKSRSYANGFLPGEVYANTYFLAEHNFTLPVVSLSFNHSFFWDNTIGIYTQGSNGIPGNCIDYPANWNQPWEREGYFEYFDENGVKQISQPAGMKISGGCSRTFGEPKSISLYARGKYGNKDFDYAFFKEKPDIRSYKSIFIRNSGNDYNRTVIWDGMMQALFSKAVDIDFQSFQPAIIYHNGDYVGMMNIREKINEDYMLSNYAVGRDSLDFMVSMLRATSDYGWYPEQGDGQDYYDIIDYLNSHDLSVDANYNWVTSKIDLQEYINYMAIRIYIVDTDWPGNNVKLWKKTENGKWRWVIYDTDFAFSFDPYNFEMIEFATEEFGPDWPNPPWSTLLFRKMLENQRFRDQFANTILTLRNTVFHPDWVNYVVDSISAIVEYEIDYHFDEHGGSKTNWNYQLNNFKDFASSRYDFIPGYIANYFGLGGSQVNVTIDNNNISHGGVRINESMIQHYPFTLETYDDFSLKVEAKPAKGYTFKNWINVAAIITENLVANGSAWKYYDQGGDYPLDWNTSGFDDTSWPSGDAQLGYGDGDESTVISYGADQNNKIPTYLFRKKVNITNVANIQQLEIGLLADDGAVVYINGQEVFRNNMPVGIPTFNSFSEGVIGNENVFVYGTIDNSSLIEGENTIACEVHQTSGTSSDVSFDLTLSYEYESPGAGGVYSNDPVIESDSSFTISIKPVFEPIERTYDIYLNEIASASMLFKDERGENSGFVEIHNHSNIDAVLNGFYISDDRLNLTRYAIPEGTEISSKGFKLFYADAEAKQGKMHMSFKPDENGETFYLSQKVGDELFIVDSIEFEFLVGGYSFGRYVDGTGDLQMMANITPNMQNDPLKPIIGIEEAFVANNIRIFPNPSQGDTKISFEGDFVFRESISLDVIDLSGKVVFPRTGVNNNINYLDLKGMENGIYFIRIFNNNNRVKTEKIVIHK